MLWTIGMPRYGCKGKEYPVIGFPYYRYGKLLTKSKQLTLLIGWQMNEAKAGCLIIWEFKLSYY